MDERRNDPGAFEGELLDALFGDEDARERARARLSAAPRGPLSLRLIEARIGRAAVELRDVCGWSKSRERSFVQRVLGSTTRSATAPVGRARRGRFAIWHGAGVVAACAALLFGALVVVARELGQDGPEVAVETAASSPASQIETAAAAFVPEPERVDVENLLTHARLVASGDASSAWRTGQVVQPGAPMELRLLQARAKGLREHRWEPWLKEVQLSDLGTLALALWCEVQLDRFALTGEVPPAWDRALAILDERREEEVVAQQSKRLLTSAVARARRYDLSDAHERRPTLVTSLWTEDWFEDLAGAGTEVGLANEPLWRAWVDWKGGTSGSL